MLPTVLLDLIIAWFSEDVGLGLVALTSTNNMLASHRSWTSPTKPNSQTPITGLVRWCTQAPFCNNSCEKTDRLWSRLHLFVLQSIALFTTLPSANQLELITLADMNHTIKCLLETVNRLKSSESLQNLQENNVQLQVSLDRLVQVLQLSLAKGAFRCSLGE